MLPLPKEQCHILDLKGVLIRTFKHLKGVTLAWPEDSLRKTIKVEGKPRKASKRREGVTGHHVDCLWRGLKVSGPAFYNLNARLHLTRGVMKVLSGEVL